MKDVLVRIQRVAKVEEVETVGEGAELVQVGDGKWKTLEILVLPYSIIFRDRRAS